MPGLPHQSAAEGPMVRRLSPVEGDGFEPSVPREEEPTRRDGFVRPARISLSRETEGSKTVSSSGPASLAVFVGPPMQGTQVNFAFRAPSRRLFTIEADAIDPTRSA